MGENENLQKKLAEVTSEKKAAESEIARVMKENIKLLEEKKSLISGKMNFIYFLEEHTYSGSVCSLLSLIG